MFDIPYGLKKLGRFIEVSLVETHINISNELVLQQVLLHCLNGRFGRYNAGRRCPRVDRVVGFKDVAGYDEVKEELDEVVQFLKNPGKFSAIGPCSITHTG